MDCKLKRESLTTQEIIFDGCEEKPVDMDFSLPDYCPDIQRILKCQVYPVITVRSIIGDRLEIEGRATVHVLYLDATGVSVRCYEKTDPFSASIPLKRTAENAVALTKTRVEYINCRAVGPRRLDIHGAYSVCAKVLDMVSNEFVSGIEEQGIEQKTQAIEASRLIACSQQQFIVNEVLEIGSGKPPAESVVRAQADILLQDQKIAAGKVIIKGEVPIKILYAAGIDTVTLESMEYVIPFSEVLDCDGVTDTALCDIHLRACDTQVQIRSDSSGENMLLEAEVKISACVAAYEDAAVTIVSDAYSTKYETELEYKPVNLRKVTDIVQDTFIQKSVFQFGEIEIMQVTDIWNEISTVRADIENDRLIYRGKMNVCILMVDKDGKPVYFERTADIYFERERVKAQPDTQCETDARVVNIGYRISGKAEIEIKAELQAQTQLFVNRGGRAVFSVYEDETRPRKKENTATLTIYYAMIGESLWDIARTYCTSVTAIQDENGMNTDAAENGGMLLIPS